MSVVASVLISVIVSGLPSVVVAVVVLLLGIFLLKLELEHLLELELSLTLDISHPRACLLLEQQNTHSFLASSACSACSVYVLLNISWWLYLDHQLNIRKVNTTGYHTSCHNLEYSAGLEVIVDPFSFPLFDISVQHLAFFTFELLI